VSSIASHVSATATVASARQQQTPGSTSDSDTDPFAALLEAVASTPDTTKPSAAAQQPVPQAATSADGSAAKIGNSIAGATADFKVISTIPGGASPDVAAKSSAAANTTNVTKTAATASATNAAVLPPAAKGKAGTTNSASKLKAVIAAANHATATAQASGGAKVAANSTDGATAPAAADATSAPPQLGAAAANLIKTAKAALANTSTQEQAASVPTQDTSGDSTIAAQSDGTANASAATTAPAVSQVQQPAAAAAQPVAVAIEVPANPVPATGNAPAADATIGETNKTRAKLTLPSAGGKNTAVAQPSNDGVPAKPAPAANKADGTASRQPHSAGASSNAPATDSSVTQQGPLQADNAVPAQIMGSATAVADQPAPRADVLAAAAVSETAGSPNTQTGASGVKADTAGLPNFGLSAANASAPSATVAAPTTPSASGTVPIAGLAVAIASRAQAGSNQFDIRLDPPELGRIDVRLDVDRDGHVTSHVTVDRADTLQLLQNQQPQLQQALEQAGLKTADNGLQFTLRDQSFAGQNNNGSGAQPSAAQLVIPDADLPAVQSTQAYNRLGLGTGIDIRV
jgi:flagellar hook-length control protein FliK